MDYRRPDGSIARNAAAPPLQVPADNSLAVLYSIACNDIAWSPGRADV